MSESEGIDAARPRGRAASRVRPGGRRHDGVVGRATPPIVGRVPWPIFNIVVALVIGVVLFKVGSTILGSFARPVPAPPDPGELRKVRLVYRCSICYTEVRMTMANDEVPEAPRHCMEDMELVTPVDDL